MPRQPAPKPKPKPNPLRNHRPINAPIALQRQAVTASTKTTTLPPKRACPNKECSAPDVQEGVCHNCGTIVDDSNIVSEVTFGESSSGAAVVQGSYVGADQSTARSLGPAFRRAGGGEDRESTVRNGKLLMTGLANQLGVNAPIIETATQIFKLASQNNFIQGRRMDMVAAVCLYTACRKTRPCTVMLIDFADKVQVNVFKLGHTFKDLHQTITLTADGMQPILPEDLIYRFANKLEFGDATGKVAEDAVRLVNRMSLDWMVVGRRPSGVCGACLILAARMNNFRRTISELVYIVKVTNHTIQKRLDEFKMTPSSTLSVADFLNNEFLSSHHDPPAFYEKTDEFQKTKKRRKKKPTYNGIPPPKEDEHRDKRQKTTTPAPEQQVEPLRIDADGFAIPPAPIQTIETSRTPTIDPNLDPSLVDPYTALVRTETNNENTGTDSNTALIHPSLESSPAPDLVDEAMADSTFGTAFSQLVSRISDEVAPRGSVPLDDDDDDAASIFSDVYASVEESQPIDETIADPNTFTHAAAFLKAQELARRHMAIADAIRPPKNVSMAVEIAEDEFDSDPEVANCLLSEEDSALKETVWVNENKRWLLTQQQKEYERKQAESGPPKARRNRKKKPRIGEGQETAASSPHEATANMLKARTVSKKIDYSAMNPMFDRIAQFGTFGSASTSRHTSRAGSILSSRESSLAPSESDDGSVAGSVMSDGTPRAPLLLIGARHRKKLTTEERRQKRMEAKARKEAAAAAASGSGTPGPISASQSESGDAEDDEGEGDPDDYVEPDPVAADDDVDVDGEGWRDALAMAGKASLGNMGEDGQFVEDDDDGGDNYVGGGDEEDYGDFDPDAIGGGDEDEY